MNIQGKAEDAATALEELRYRVEERMEELLGDMVNALKATTDGLSKLSDSIGAHNAAMRAEQNELKVELMREHATMRTEMEDLKAELAQLRMTCIEVTGVGQLGATKLAFGNLINSGDLGLLRTLTTFYGAWKLTSRQWRSRMVKPA